MKKIIFFVLPFVVLIAIALVSYLFPVFPDINPFYTSTSFENINGESYGENYRKDIFSQVKADLPDGWSIETTNKEREWYEGGDDTYYEGLVYIHILKEDTVVCNIYAAEETGGIGITFYKFPDYDPDAYSALEDIGEDYKIVIEIKEGEYTEISLFGLESRRVGYVLLPNSSNNPDKYFANSNNPIIFNFDDDSVQYWYYSGEKKVVRHDYKVWISEDLTNEELLVLDTILDTMESL